MQHTSVRVVSLNNELVITSLVQRINSSRNECNSEALFLNNRQNFISFLINFCLTPQFMIIVIRHCASQRHNSATMT